MIVKTHLFATILSHVKQHWQDGSGLYKDAVPVLNAELIQSLQEFAAIGSRPTPLAHCAQCNRLLPPSTEQLLYCSAPICTDCHTALSCAEEAARTFGQNGSAFAPAPLFSEDNASAYIAEAAKRAEAHLKHNKPKDKRVAWAERVWANVHQEEPDPEK